MCLYNISELEKTLSDCINKRNYTQLRLYLSNIDTEWAKVEKDPESYAYYLEQLHEAYEENSQLTSKQFFKDFEHPIHPQFVIDRLVEYTTQNNTFKMTLLHKACQVVRASEKQSKVTVNLIDCLLKVRYPVYNTDKDGNMAINTLLCDSVNEQTFIKVLQMHIKYNEFDVLKVPLSEDGETEYDSFLIAFLKSQKQSQQVIDILKARLMKLNFEEINALVEKVNNLGIPLTQSVNDLLSNLKKEMIKHRKVPALFLYVKIQAKAEKQKI